MIVKILSSTKNFEGIDYSERKADKGISQLMLAANFDALGHNSNELTKADYINYMRLICDSNPRVSNRQFHAVISTKGNQHSPEQLASMAEQYLKEMGYGDNPFLIYHHSDTDNNHVHMVSTRVDKNGDKVDDTYEKIRSQKALQKILQQDPQMEAKATRDKAMTYNFSTTAQFKLLLEQQAFKLKEERGKLSLIKYGTVQVAINLDPVKMKAENYREPNDRASQLKALFYKYKAGLELEDFMKYMREKFGIDIVLHKQGKHDMPYGYTVIDHPKKQVFKGSQIMKLKELLNPLSDEEGKETITEFLKGYNYQGNSLYKLKSELLKNGFVLNYHGEVSIEKQQEVLAQLSKSQLNTLRYNNRIESANKYHIESEKGKAALARLFNILDKDLSIGQKQHVEFKNYYSNILLSLGQRRSANEMLEAHHLSILKYQNTHFLFDASKKCLYELSGLITEMKFDVAKIKVLDLDNAITQDYSSSTNKSLITNLIASLFDIPMSESGNQKVTKKKKRKQRQI